MKKLIFLTAIFAVVLASCNEPIVKISSIKFEQDTVYMELNDTRQLECVIKPNDATETVSFESSNREVARVNGKGEVTALSYGEAVITAKSPDGNRRARCVIIISNAPHTLIIAPKSVILGINAEATLTATILPETAENKDVKYTLSPASSNVVELVQTGNTAKITGKNGGTVRVIATSLENSSLKDTCEVTIDPSIEKPVTGVTLSPKNVALILGNTQQLTYVVTPADATNPAVTFSSSNSAVASVNSTGLVTAVGNGTARVTITTINGAKTDFCDVSVSSILVTSVTVSPTTKTLVGGTPFQVIATVLPENASVKTLTWTSSNPAVATVDQNGNVTALTMGNSNITATSQDGSNKSGTCVLTVTYPLGSEQNPFLVTNQATLRKVGTGTDGWTLSAHYKQTANISLTSDFAPIGTSTSPFTGNYDGGNFTISNLTINASSTGVQGMFGRIGSGAVVKNIKLQSSNITGAARTGAIAGENYGTIQNCSIVNSVNINGHGNFTGGLVGYNLGGGVVENCVVEGASTIIKHNTTSNNNSYGGVVGINASGATIRNCTFKSVVNGGNSTYVGGIVGKNDGSVQNCNSTGTITGRYTIGGIVGNNTGTIQNGGHTTGAVTATADNGWVGGVVGENSGTIDNVFCRSATIKGQNSVGGVVGGHGGTSGARMTRNSYSENVILMNSNNTSTAENFGGIIGNLAVGTVQNCYSIKAKTTLTSGISRNIGGIAGRNITGTVQYCYAADFYFERGNFVGGIVGSNNGIISNCYSAFSYDNNFVNINNISATTSGGIAGINDGTSALIEKCFSTINMLEGVCARGGIAGRNINGGRIERCVALSKNIRLRNQSGSSNTECIDENPRRIAGQNTSSTLTGNYARARAASLSATTGMLLSNARGNLVNITSTSTASNLDGETATDANLWGSGSATWWANTMQFSSTYWTFTANALPRLRNVGGVQSGFMILQ